MNAVEAATRTRLRVYVETGRSSDPRPRRVRDKRTRRDSCGGGSTVLVRDVDEGAEGRHPRASTARFNGKRPW